MIEKWDDPACSRCPLAATTEHFQAGPLCNYHTARQDYADARGGNLLYGAWLWITRSGDALGFWIVARSRWRSAQSMEVKS